MLFSPLLIVGSIPDEKHKMRYGGATVLTKNFLSHLNRNDIKYSFVQNNKYSNLKTGEKRLLLNALYFLFWFTVTFPFSKRVLFNYSDNGVIKLYPTLNRLCKLFGKKVALRKFGGSLEEAFSALPDSKKENVIVALNNTDCIFFETQAAISHLKEIVKEEVTICRLPNSRNSSPYINNGTFEYKLVFMSQIEKAKGVDELIAVKEMLPPNYTLDVYGYIQEEHYKTFDWSRHKINFHGELPSEKVLETISKYSILLLPSYREGQPGILIEALSCGVPVIATKVGGIPEIITDGYNGRLVGLADVEALKDAILSINASNFHTYSRNALCSFNEHFNSAHVNKQACQLLTSL